MWKWVRAGGFERDPLRASVIEYQQRVIDRLLEQYAALTAIIAATRPARPQAGVPMSDSLTPITQPPTVNEADHDYVSAKRGAK